MYYVPLELRDYDICLAAVQTAGWALQFVPPRLRDYDICMAAVKQDGIALEYVPPRLQAKIKAAMNKK